MSDITAFSPVWAAHCWQPADTLTTWDDGLAPEVRHGSQDIGPPGQRQHAVGQGTVHIVSIDFQIHLDGFSLFRG